MKNVTDFCKTVETGVDPRLLWLAGECSPEQGVCLSVVKTE